MNAQPSLFPAEIVHGAARYLDPPTSHRAARSDFTGITADVIAAHRAHPDGLTDDEMCALVLPFEARRWPTAKSARSRLTAAGLLVDSGVVRRSIVGRDQTVWRIAG